MTVRRQVFTRLLILASATFLFGALATVMLLEPFYLLVRSQRTLGVARDIAAVHSGRRPDQTGGDVEGREGLLLTVVDIAGRSVNPLTPAVPLPAEVASLSAPGDHFFHLGPVPGANIHSISLFYLLDRDTILIVSSPLPLVQESIAVALVFYLLQALLGMAVSILLAWRFSARFSAPVQALNRRALEISKLRFESPPIQPRNAELRSLDASLSLISGPMPCVKATFARSPTKAAR